jgi:hypothetical protein
LGVSRANRDLRLSASSFCFTDLQGALFSGILMEGPEKHRGKDYFFSADALTPQQVAESLTAATGRKFTAEP